MHVLLIEDDPVARRLLRHLAESQGHTVTACSDAEEGWQAFNERSYPLILLDLMLPRMSGIDLCRQIRSSPRGAFCVVVVVTALTEPGYLEEVLEAGADDYVAKPINVELIRVRLAIAARRARHIIKHEKAEEQVRQLAAAVRSSREGIMLMKVEEPDVAPTIVFANESIAHMTGYSNEDLVGKPVSIFNGPETNPFVLDEINEAISAGQPFSNEVVHYNSEKIPFLVQWDLAPVRDRAGQISHYVSIQRDITERRRLEKELVEISEREQRRIGQDLHDGLGQQLTGLAFMTKSLERKLDHQDPEIALHAENLSSLVNEIKQQARTISRGLVTVDFRNNGFVMTLENLVAHTAQYSGIRCAFRNDLEGPITDEAIATHLYRICQEALNNALTHSQATRITVELLQKDEHIILRVIDNGCGMEDQQPEGEGLGLRIMSYRARMINAKLEINSLKEGGTVVSCSVLYAGVSV